MRQIRALWRDWWTPIQTDADAAFHERTLRLAIPLFTLANIIQSTLILLNPDIPNSRAFRILASTLVLVVAGMILHRGRVKTAAALMGVIFQFTLIFPQLNQGYWSGFMYIVLGTGAMFSLLVYKRRHAIIYISLLVMQFSMIAFWQHSAQVPYPNPLRATDALTNPVYATLGMTAFMLFIVGLNTYYSREFNRRAYRVNELVKTLEARVQARTADLEAANQQLTALASVKDRFVSSVSHELRSPITNLKLRYDLLERQPHMMDTHLEVIRRETDRLASTIDSLLTLSQLDQGRKIPEWTVLDLNALAQQYVDDRTTLAQKKNLTLRVTTHTADQRVRVRADANLLGQAVSILLTNAMTYTPPGGTVTVQAGEQTIDGIAWGGIAVSDTGPGIPPDDQTRLFERFFRGKAARTTKAPGTGLGLAILKEIVDRHGGQVEVHSTGIPGEGACFTILLPPAP